MCVEKRRFGMMLRLLRKVSHKDVKAEVAVCLLCDCTVLVARQRGNGVRWHCKLAEESFK